ncbi:MAG: carboxynorspermidine decarboxylase [Syntrophotalea acetylenica]|uniref:Carboxynorspermidine/carboxyspermidine decarboxylase n=1 Tax=Syntrophotalea acetylenica TaxID=29542 RepID=A0A1L3GHP2_SYNAC|nr:carboxynorspermidine decarboxylase [Syntrophotalea acetylenica]APG25453.1 carboxynorspermidine decarboxylase [Syntrophotalea acetylenica]APG43519.1 carboxynorspermidine decarboxylase [Syntrophotalea acetylenica]MDD4457353.1 carboxynorspermidine decarboxylase [Syntrophotalea acetylenica]
MTGIDIPKILELAPSPAYVIDLGRLRHNLEILDRVQRRSGAKILLALKAFALWRVFPLIRQTLHGVCASSPWEARLGREEFGREVHSFAAAFKQSDVVELLGISNHLVFNSFAQLERFRPLWEKQKGRVSIGLRINPEHSEGHTAIYDPCAPGSRLGIPRAEFEGRSLAGVEGLHFHTLCEQLFEPLSRTAAVVEDKFGCFLPGMKWFNFGGGHHITREGYDIDGLVELIRHFRGKYGVEVYLEPGEAIAIGTGLLVSEVLDVVHNQVSTAILDVSATCHMPDVLEMPYRPGIHGGFDAGEQPFTYRLGGPSCLAGDVIGDWSFNTPLAPGQRLAFLDMAHYTMVKTTTFNGIQHPHICTYEPETGQLEVLRSFVYEDFKNRLA